jgi:hypothetical protein
LRTWKLHDTIVKNKKLNGIFYAPEQKVYVFYTKADTTYQTDDPLPSSDLSQPLREDAIYKMTVSIDDGKIIVIGETDMIRNISLGSWINSSASFTLTKGPINGELGDYANQSISVSNVGNSYIMDANVYFNYREFSNGYSDSIDKSVVINLGETKVSSSHSFSLVGETFYNRLKDEIPQSNLIDKRVHQNFEIEIIGASEELANYIELNKAPTSLAQNKPKYTNLSTSNDYNVIGIFTSKQTIKVKKVAYGIGNIQAMNTKSRRELCIGPITGSLNFCSRFTGDMGTSYKCNF